MMAVDYQKENKSYDEAHGILVSAIRPGIETTEVLEIYDNWASNYDKVCVLNIIKCPWKRPLICFHIECHHRRC